MKKLGEITSWKSGGTPTKDRQEYWNGNISWISASSMRGNEFSNSNLKITELGLKNGSRLAEKNSLLLLVRGSMLFNSIPIGIATKDLAFNQDVKAIKTTQSTNEEYLLYWFLSKESMILNLVTGTGIGAGKLDTDDLKSLIISFPNSTEQKKVISLLSRIDKRIQTQMEIINNLKTLKTAVAKKIFSQELRFKDDIKNNFPEWKNVCLGDIGEIITGKTPSTSDLNLWNGDMQFVTPTDINENKYQYYTVRTIKQTEKLKTLPSKSIMYTCIASIGKMSLSLKPCVTNQQINSIIPNSDFNNEFVYYAVANISEYIKSTQSSSTMPIINKKEFSKFKILVGSLEEQTKIADFLSSIDSKIDIEVELLQKLENQKKYLLQNMFV